MAPTANMPAAAQASCLGLDGMAKSPESEAILDGHADSFAAKP